MKKVILPFVLLTIAGIGLFINSETQSSNSSLSSLPLNNPEALSQNENGLPDGWVTERIMDEIQIKSTTSVSGGVSAGAGGIGGTVEGEQTWIWVSCCVYTGESGDACDKTSEHSECNNRIS